MALHLHRAERTDRLADGLGALLSDPLPDPFTEELVLVPARGVERWLSQRLSHILGRGAGTDGVCAGIRFRSPHSLIAEITGTTHPDTWAPDATVWPLLEVIDESLDEPWCRTLATHLGHFEDGEEKELRRGRRYAVARRLAGLFASYAAQRPAMLVNWLDGHNADLDADLHWQPELWRALVNRVDAEPPHLLHSKTLARLREGPADLPPRLSLFGHTRLPVTEIELLDALATHHELHLWCPHISDNLWQALRDRWGPTSPALPPIPRRDDDSHRELHHPLLATLGRDLRELQRGLPAARTDEFLGSTDRDATLLGWLQSDLAANAVSPKGRIMADNDRSVQVHGCHGPARQIDVLREVLLGLLADDPTLEPRDVLVMCPDIEKFAPLMVAGFGLGDLVAGAHPAHRLRVRLADRSLVQTNALLGVASQLLALAGGRATAGEVLNFAAALPVRARFAFTDDDLDSITAWVREANIRWGFDREHRKPFGVDYVHNSWQFGIDRVLAGVAMSDDSHAWLDITLPLDDVSSNRVELAGRFAEYVDRLRRVVTSLTGERPLRDWLNALSDGITRLARLDDSEAWQMSQVQREFADILATAGPRADTPMRLPDIRALLGRQLAGRPTRANFRTGTLTVCTMVPMRSVPHRVVCLVGLDDGVFPRIGVIDGDDALARNPMTGERDIRSEDRQLLLDAICAATEKLVITYTGANEYTGQPRPPAVPLAELLDALDATTSLHVGNRVVINHPLQPFDIRNVKPGELGVPGEPFTFDPTALTAARASACGPRPVPPEFLSEPLPASPPGDVTLADLTGFFKDPVKGFFRALDVTLPWDVDGVQDTMPVAIDALQEWSVGNRMLQDMLRGMNPDDARQAEWRRGSLPPGRLGWRKAEELQSRAAELAKVALQHRTPAPDAYDVDLDLGGGRRLSGTVSPVFGLRTVTVTYSRLDGRQLLESWIRLAALTAHRPGVEWSALCIGRPRTGYQADRQLLGPPEDAIGVLRDLVAVYDAGRLEPIPLPVKTSFAWATARHEGRDTTSDASYPWRFEREEPAIERVWGPHATLADLLTPLRRGEEFGAETTRLGAFAGRLWLPILGSLRNYD
jgi:exodeoxyribonuclease V gamma subunit